MTTDMTTKTTDGTMEKISKKQKNGRRRGKPPVPRDGGGAAHYRYNGAAHVPRAEKRDAAPPPVGGWDGLPPAGKLAAGAAIALALAAALFAVLLSL